jgi:hypothetical protein
MDVQQNRASVPPNPQPNTGMGQTTVEIRTYFSLDDRFGLLATTDIYPILARRKTSVIVDQYIRAKSRRQRFQNIASMSSVIVKVAKRIVDSLFNLPLYLLAI